VNHKLPEITRLVSTSEEETMRLGAALAVLCAPGDCIALIGGLGLGKTAFARGFIQALTPEADVASPTYALALPYEAAFPLWHCDFYRLEHEDELAELGLDEMLEGVCLIEWPQIALARLPAQRLEIAFSEAGQQARILVVSGNAPWYSRLNSLGNL
jgi:tRNA threonylcarbamoyl adenosine modification protein YjeE